MSWNSIRASVLVLFAGAGSAGCDAPLAHAEESAAVVATAYNSVPDQTSGDPTLGAWGDRLEPGTKAIAVSRDLEGRGLRRGVRVRIDGLDGEYRVLDRMARRWKQRIDIYMGTDLAAAREWGRRRVRIHWNPAE